MHQNKSLSKDFILRPLQEDDYNKGFKECLSNLTDVSGLTLQVFQNVFYEMKQNSEIYLVLVVEDIQKNIIAASGTVFIEKKFIRGGGKVAHIEDIVVQKDYRGKDLGKSIVESLTAFAFANSCYKVILDCNERNVSFYEKCGFDRKEVQMAQYHLSKSKI